MSLQDTQKKAQKKWEDLTLANAFVFSKVLLNEKLCKKIIQELLDIPPIEDIRFLESEKIVDVDYETKSVRLDLYVQGIENTVYNIEMQVRNTGELPQRSRQYQSIIDVDILGKGEDYRELPDSYVIFICRVDIFKRGLYRYTFMNTCQELPDLKLEDGTQIVFLNTKGTIGDISEDTKAFLDYIEGQMSEKPFIRELEAEVMRVKSNREWRQQYMRAYLRDQVNWKLAKEEGKTEGEIEIKFKIVENGLKNNIPVETISIMTGLSIQEIEKLKEGMPNLK